MEKIKIINWDKDLCDKKAKEYEDYTNNKNNISFNFTKKEQKHYWLTVFLPSVLAFIVFIVIFFLASRIPDDFAKWTVRIGACFATGIFLAIKWFDIVKDYILPAMGEIKTCDAGLRLIVFLPSVLSFVVFIVIFFLASRIPNVFVKWTVRIGSGFAAGIFLAIKWFDIVKDYVLPLIEEEKTCDTGIKFHKAVAGKEIVDLIYIDGFPINDSKCVSKPVMLMLKDEQGNESSYEFKPNEWEFAATNKEIPIVDVEGGIVFCPEQSSYRGADDSCT